MAFHGGWRVGLTLLEVTVSICHSMTLPPLSDGSKSTYAVERCSKVRLASVN
jgi:hypothetical protein